MKKLKPLLNKLSCLIKVEDRYGYKISADGGESFGYYIQNSSDYLNYEDDLYVIDETNDAEAMWVASPSFSDSTYVYKMNYDGYVGRYFYSSRSVGFRPLVCLQSNVQLEKQQDGSFLLK